MKRRSNWPLAAILLTALVVQAGLTAFSGTTSAGGSLVRDGVICTACGPISSGACPLEDRPLPTGSLVD
jgi:hypothetical protein